MTPSEPTEAKLLKLIVPARQPQEAAAPKLPARSSLEEMFARFRADPLPYATVQLRRLRAGQLRRLLARPDTIDLDTFTREVWRTWHSMSLGGELVTASAETHHLVDSARAPEGERGAPASSLSGSEPQDRTVRTEHVQRAIGILNDATLSPLQKALALDQVPGFGADTASGLVMVYHPEEFAIYNGAAQAGLRLLGYSFHDIETFERAAEDLKARLGATDFLELDWFLSLVGQKRIPVPQENGSPDDQAKPAEQTGDTKTPATSSGSPPR
jgi:hypothetical protein